MYVQMSVLMTRKGIVGGLLRYYRLTYVKCDLHCYLTFFLLTCDNRCNLRNKKSILHLQHHLFITDSDSTRTNYNLITMYIS